MSGADREVEAKLLVRSPRPREVAGEVAALGAVGRFRLLPRGTLRLRDSYLDTADGALGRAGASVRIRTADAERWVTFKGPARRDRAAGLVERAEAELPWTAGAAERIRAAAAEVGVRLPAPPADAGDDPWEVLGGMGLRVIQDRATERRVREVVAEEDGPPLAELVVDSVRYEVGGDGVWHHEVEVEAKGEGGAAVVREAADALRERFPGVLVPWTRGKLATGRALERLAREGRLEGVVGPEGDLTPEAYTLLRGG